MLTLCTSNTLLYIYKYWCLIEISWRLPERALHIVANRLLLSVKLLQFPSRVRSWSDGLKRWCCYLLTELYFVLTLWGKFRGSCRRVECTRWKLKFRVIFIVPNINGKIPGERFSLKMGYFWTGLMVCNILLYLHIYCILWPGPVFDLLLKYCLAPPTLANVWINNTQNNPT